MEIYSPALGWLHKLFQWKRRSEKWFSWLTSSAMATLFGIGAGASFIVTVVVWFVTWDQPLWNSTTMLSLCVGLISVVISRAISNKQKDESDRNQPEDAAEPARRDLGAVLGGAQQHAAEASRAARAVEARVCQDLHDAVINRGEQGAHSEDDVARAAEALVRRHGDDDPSSFRTLLWVDDNPANNRFERSALEGAGFRIDLALSTSHALVVIQERDYALVISDMGRPAGVTAGHDLLQEMRDQGSKTPFVVYAGETCPEFGAKTTELGGQGNTNDPVTLIKIVADLMASKRGASEPS